VKLLLDTHTLLWFLRDDPNLSAAAKALILDPANHKFVSVASCWEIAIKATRNKLSLTEPSGVLLGRELPRNGFDLLAIELRHATHVEHLPEHHKDPFDRLLAAQSLLEGMPMVSVDVQLDAYGISRLW
jgi:PIN domain nuclease of toxin-antitoxin system